MIILGRQDASGGTPNVTKMQPYAALPGFIILKYSITDEYPGLGKGGRRRGVLLFWRPLAPFPFSHSFSPTIAKIMQITFAAIRIHLLHFQRPR